MYCFFLLPTKTKSRRRWRNVSRSFFLILESNLDDKKENFITFWKKYLYNLICFLFFPLQKWIFSAPKNCHLDVDFLTFTYLAGFHLLKVNNRNSWTRREICSKLTIKTQEWRQICSKLTMKTPEQCHFPSFRLNTERNLNIFGVVLVSLLQDTYFYLNIFHTLL